MQRTACEPGLAAFRVWPDDTVQAVDDGAPYSWLSDDFLVVQAADEEAALGAAHAIENAAWAGTVAAVGEGTHGGC